jgi:hypothetical protein
MHFKAQFVPWRTAVAAVVATAGALTFAGIAHAHDIVDTFDGNGSVAMAPGDPGCGPACPDLPGNQVGP